MDEHGYRILSLLERNSSFSQRKLASALGVSLGKVNSCLKALAESGMLNAGSSRGSRSKRGYLYCLTRKGIREKSRVTAEFLRLKESQYEALRKEIAHLRAELARAGDTAGFGDHGLLEGSGTVEQTRNSANG
ncbi:MarR family EPS-associated transcriptional regulator [Methylocaldum sp.]|uniref:MarR family EPS-associated transcriptional regulator n=1 Tax=Methylocaldum sp. TaxID=1969727 RepID=UPI003220759E